MIRTAEPYSDRSETKIGTIGCLMRRLVDESRVLMKQEVELAKAEMREKASVFGRNAIYLAIGGFVLYTGALALVAAACIGTIVLLDQWMDLSIALWLGPLLVGGVIALVGYAFVQKAINTFRNETLTPQKTIDSLRENREWLKDQMTTSTETMTR